MWPGKLIVVSTVVAGTSSSRGASDADAGDTRRATCVSISPTLALTR
jgi:hypothetical protein